MDKKLQKCKNGHFYDDNNNENCPYCSDLDTSEEELVTQAFVNTDNIEDDERTLPADSIDEHGPTIPNPHFKEETYESNFDPVVGWLVCVTGDDSEKGRSYTLHSEKNYIGRSELMDITINGDLRISRERHAVISYNPKSNSFKIYPGESRGLVYLNGEEVDIPKKLEVYDNIELGNTLLIFIPFCGEHFQW